MRHRKSTTKDITPSPRAAAQLLRFDLYPNRGIDHPFQPRAYQIPGKRFGRERGEPVACTHGVPWTSCDTCSKPMVKR